MSSPATPTHLRKKSAYDSTQQSEHIPQPRKMLYLKKLPNTLPTWERRSSLAIVLNKAQVDLIDTLPAELVRRVFHYLNPIFSACFGLTCKRLYTIHRELHGIVNLDDEYTCTGYPALNPCGHILPRDSLTAGHFCWAWGHDSVLSELLVDWMRKDGYKWVVEETSKIVTSGWGKRTRIKVLMPGIFVRKQRTVIGKRNERDMEGGRNGRSPKKICERRKKGS